MKRRWMRFGLRAMLAVTAAVGLACGLLVMMIESRRQEERTLAQLREDHASSSFNVHHCNPFAMEAGPVDPFVDPGPAWLKEALGVDMFRTLTLLTCYPRGNSFSYGVDEDGRIQITRNFQNGLREQDLQRLSRFPHLRHLLLEANPVTDRGAACISQLRNLETLNLAHSAITDQGLAHLARLPKLRVLDISRTDVTDDSLPLLAGWQGLEELNLELTRMSDEGVRRLERQRPDCQIQHRAVQN